MRPPSAAPRVIVSELAGDDDARDLVEAFVASLDERARAVEDAAATGDWTSLHRLAHKLAGAGGSYGFPLITAIAADIEAAAKRRTACAESITALADVCRRARSAA